jgi:type III restriction enzyme
MPEVIKNPIINSPYHEPSQHHAFDDGGITNQIVAERRVSSYFSPIPKIKSRKAQMAVLPGMDELVPEKIEENKYINELRAYIKVWRTGEKRYDGVTRTTRLLLDYWQDEGRFRRLFFAQIEAVETAIFLTEVVPNVPHLRHFAVTLGKANETATAMLQRMAFKVCTGGGKTAVMGMLIAWHTLNKMANPQNPKFADAFLIVAPGITIRDRLRVLLPSDPDNYYITLDLVPPHLRDDMNRAKITLVNFHAFRLRDTGEAAALTKKLLTDGATSPFLETPAQMVTRVCRDLGNKKNIVVFNDEGHHCWTRRPDTDEAAAVKALTSDEKKALQKESKAAHLWHTGLEHVKAKLGIRAIYDLSATPFFLKGSGYPEGVLFPWVVSDFSLIDGIESGIVKVPRVPVSDDTMSSEGPKFRNLWANIKHGLPKAGRGKMGERVSEDPNLPKELEAALDALYTNYRKFYEGWDGSAAAQAATTPPVFIVVCQNTQISKLVYDYVSGYEITLTDGKTKRLKRGAFDLFSNVNEDGEWLHRPNTILVDSEQLESGEGLTDEFKKIAAREIEEFKTEYRIRYPGRDADDLTDEDILREVMNTVGKRGKLGEGVRCVVSVSMLTEGWDANTVTHVLGVRAFGTQLLCEQVVGRALRRMSYAPNAEGMLEPEYAEVFGVPFSFIPSAGTPTDPQPGPIPTRVRALEERREACEIRFPRVLGYRFDLPTERLTADFQSDHCYFLSTRDIPMNVEVAPVVGESVMISVEEAKHRRVQEVEFYLAHLVLKRFFHDADQCEKPWLFPQVLTITKHWMQKCLHCGHGTFPQLLRFREPADEAAEKIYAGIASTIPDKRLLPILRPYEYVGTTRYVDFLTTRPTYMTRADKCHISHVVCDTDTWEQKMAQVLEDEMDEVKCYVKNHNLGFTIPYTFAGKDRQYIPDFIAHMDDGYGKNDPLQLIIEVTGERKNDKQAKAMTAKEFWIPAVNNYSASHFGAFGRWSYIEIADPWDAVSVIRGHVAHDPFAHWFPQRKGKTEQEE